MNKMMMAGLVGAMAMGAFAAPQYNDLIKYVNDGPGTKQEAVKDWRGKITGYKTVEDYSGHGFSYIQVAPGVKSIEIKFTEFTDLNQSPYGIFAYTGEFKSANDAVDYATAYRAEHSEATINPDGMTLRIDNLDQIAGSEEGVKIGLWMSSISGDNRSGRKEEGSMIAQFNFREGGKYPNSNDFSKLGKLIDDDYNKVSINVFFGDYSNTGWRANDVVTIKATVLEYVDPNTGAESTIVAYDDPTTGETVVEETPVDAPAGQPLPGVLAVLLLAGGIGGAAKLRKAKKA